MAWMSLGTLLTLVQRARQDPRRYTVYIPDNELPVPPQPHHGLGSHEMDEAEDESTDFDNGED